MERQGRAAAEPSVVLCAPNAFKGSLDAPTAAAALARGALRGGATDARALGVADGGDGTLDVLLAAAGPRGTVSEHVVSGPLDAPVAARLGWIEAEGAVVELSEAAGMRLLQGPPNRASALSATSRGVGELIVAALDGGARRILVGLGGSACSDGGAGLLGALGARLLSAAGEPIPGGGGGLADLAAVDLRGLDPRLRGCRLEVASDVTSPLLGPVGAAGAFSPQKGAGPAEVARLEAGHRRLAELLEHECGVDVALRSLPGAGAAGGCGYALAVSGAALRGGAGLVCETIALDASMRGCSLVLTGEGRLDSTSLAGKAPVEVAARARRIGIPCVAVVGTADLGGEPGDALPFTAVRALARPGGPSVEEAMRRTAELLSEAAAAVVAEALALSRRA